MSLKKICNEPAFAAMSLISVIVFLIILLVTTVKADTQIQQNKQISDVQNFRDLVSKMIKEQSTKIQTLFKKIQMNAQMMLQTIQDMKRNSVKSDLNSIARLKKDTSEVESTIEKSVKAQEVSSSSRSFNNHYTTTGYGSSGHGSSGHGHTGNGNYGTQTYHHHSIGFDPLNIVVSMSLLSFLLQAIQGLLSRTRAPTPVVEARSLDFVQDWLTAYREKNINSNFLKYPKKYQKKNLFKNYAR